MTLLEAKGLGHSFDGQQPILKDVSFSVEAGESLGIIGPNGGGKTTLLKILVGALRPTSGNIQADGQDLLHGDFPHGLFSYVAQHNDIDCILPLRVRDMVLFGALNRPKDSLRPVDEVLELVGLAHKAHYRFDTLSGGERQRALLARALLARTRILVLDEPTNGLDSTGQDQLLGILREAQKKFGMAVVMVGHDISQMLKSCDRLLCLNRTHHWHDRKEMLTPKVLESIYHCEFEHLMIHLEDGPQEGQDAQAHHACDHPPGQHFHDNRLAPPKKRGDS